jgi:hypothetical protein
VSRLVTGCKRDYYPQRNSASCCSPVTNLLHHRLADNVLLAFTSPLLPKETEIGRHILVKGDAVKDVAFACEDAKALYEVRFMLPFLFPLLSLISIFSVFFLFPESRETRRQECAAAH